MEIERLRLRVVTVLDFKSIGIFPRRFEPCSVRLFFSYGNTVTSFFVSYILYCTLVIYL